MEYSRTSPVLAVAVEAGTGSQAVLSFLVFKHYYGKYEYL